MDEQELGRRARRLRDVVEPIAAGVYFAPEAHAAYRELGIEFIPGYFCSRGACLGRAPWSVICAVFGAFKPEVVRDAVTEGWSKTDPESLLAARQEGAEAQLTRICGEPGEDVARATELLSGLTDGVDPSGRVLFSGLMALPRPETPWGAFWRAIDLVRERRGDGHLAAWIPHLDSCEVTLLTELTWEIPPRSYAFTRGWSDADMDAGHARLEARGLVQGDTITEAGRDLRSRIERATDSAEREVLERLGDDTDELCALLEPWAKAILVNGEYPTDPAAMPEIRR